MEEVNASIEELLVDQINKISNKMNDLVQLIEMELLLK
jgi:hypothetical protein